MPRSSRYYQRQLSVDFPIKLSPKMREALRLMGRGRKLRASSNGGLWLSLVKGVDYREVHLSTVRALLRHGLIARFEYGYALTLSGQRVVKELEAKNV